MCSLVILGDLTQEASGSTKTLSEAATVQVHCTPTRTNKGKEVNGRYNYLDVDPEIDVEDDSRVWTREHECVNVRVYYGV